MLWLWNMENSCQSFFQPWRTVRTSDVDSQEPRFLPPLSLPVTVTRCRETPVWWEEFYSPGASVSEKSGLFLRSHKGELTCNLWVGVFSWGAPPVARSAESVRGNSHRWAYRWAHRWGPNMKMLQRKVEDLLIHLCSPLFSKQCISKVWLVCIWSLKATELRPGSLNAPQRWAEFFLWKPALLRLFIYPCWFNISLFYIQMYKDWWGHVG